MNDKEKESEYTEEELAKKRHIDHVNDDEPICSECKSNLNVQYLGGEGYYCCQTCDNKFYIESENPRNIGTLNYEDLFINILTYNPKREVAFTINDDGDFDIGITIIRNKEE